MPEHVNRTHVVALSGGKDSTALALRLAEVEPRDYEYICTPTGNELPEMVDHWKNLESILGKPIKRITNELGLIGMSVAQKCIPNWRQRWCTRILKIEPYQAYMSTIGECVSYVGIRADEAENRDGADNSKYPNIEQRFPLVEWGWGVNEVYDYLAHRNIKIPRRTDCALCFYQRMSEWWLLWHDHPDEFEKGVVLEELVGHTFRSENKDNWPGALNDLRKAFEDGRIPRGAAQLELDLGVYSRSKMCTICAR